MRLYILIAFRNLVKARRRTLLLGAAIAIVTMLMVMLMSLSQGLTDTMIKNVTLQLAGHVNVAGFFKAKSSDAIPMVTRVKELRKIVEENTPDLDYVIDRGRGWGKMISNVTSIQVIISSVDIDEEKNFVKTIQLAKENEYRKDGKPVALGDPMKLREPKQIMISETQAKRMQLTVGDPVSLTVESAGGMANLTEATVCAVTKANGFMSNWNVFVSKKTLSDLYDMDEDASGAIMVYLKDIKNSETAMKKLRIALTEKGFDLREYQPDPYWMKFEDVKEEDFRGQKLDLTTWSDEAKFAQWILTAFSTISFVLITILTAIIVIGIMNAMWAAVELTISVLGKGQTASFRSGVAAKVDGAVYRSRMHTVAYPHIQTHRYYTESKANVVVLDLKAEKRNIGYIMGSGDEVPEAIRQIGMPVTMLEEKDLASGDIAAFDSIVVGVRATETRPDMMANKGRLLDYVKNGGNLIVQYQRGQFANSGLPPFPVTTTATTRTAAGAIARVVDETAKVTILQPQHPFFTTPNAISDKDFEGWVQERNAYNLVTMDPQYVPLLESHDVGEADNNGGLVTVKFGKGTWTYCSYSFFRQLPAGVPGAYRLFANLVSQPRK